MEFIDDADIGHDNAAFGICLDDGWYRYNSTPDWSAIAMAAVKEPGSGLWAVLAVSSSGNVWELLPKGPSERTIKIPDAIGITNLATIGQRIYACGMGRKCYIRAAEDTWVDISAPWPGINEGVIGFTDMTGLSEDLIYAVGWAGEVWIRAMGSWQRQDSPTNANLNAVAISPDGVVYCVGDDGFIMQGKQDAWQVVDAGLSDNLMDVCVHNDEVYCCSDFEIFKLTDDGMVSVFSGEEEDFPDTCLRLLTDDNGSLYSVGPYDVFVLNADGWQRLA